MRPLTFKPRTKGVPTTIRTIRCFKCDEPLAKEASDSLTKTAYEWWFVTPSGLWCKGRWWGNAFKCPKCGAEGKLPIDKPLSCTED